MARKISVILMDRVAQLGELGDEVRVAPGYARNFLFPKSLAVVSTPEVRKEFRARREEYAQRAQQARDAAQERAEAVQGKTLTIQAQATENGRLYGKVSAVDVVQAAKELDPAVELDRREVRLPREGVRQVGEHGIDLQLHPDVIAQVTLQVEAS